MRTNSISLEEFSEQLKDKLQQQLVGEYPGIKLDTSYITGAGVPAYQGITITLPDRKRGTIIDAEPLYRAFSDNVSFNEILSRAEEESLGGLSRILAIDSKEMTAYEQMKDKVIMQVISVKGNEERLADMPHRQMEDMAVVYRMLLDTPHHSGEMSFLVTNSIMQGYGITPEQLYEDASFNMSQNMQYSIRPLFSVLAELNPVFAKDSMQKPDDTLFVCTNEKSMYGAGAIAHPEFMEEACKKLQGNFFVLPSSIHEVLLMKDDGQMDYRALQEMVAAINASEVQPKDRLTDNVYHVDAVEHIFETAKHFHERQMEKDMGRGSVLKDLADSRKAAHEQPVRPRSAPERGGAVL